MIYQKRKQLTREQDDLDRADWNNVHNQLRAVQKKSLTINAPGDAHEKEADEVARKVVNGEPAQILMTSGKIQPEIQRKHGNNTLTVDVTGPIAHADGVYNATLGTLRTPTDDSGYTETLKADPKNLYDTYYSVAIRFGIDVNELMKENPARPEDKIFHDIDIFIPDIAPKQNANPQQNATVPFPGLNSPTQIPFETNETETTEQEVVYKTSDEEWQTIKKGDYNNDALAQLNAAKKVKASYTYLNLLPREQALIDEIIAMQGDVYVRTFEKDYVKYNMSNKKQKKIKADVQQTAWEIVRDDARVRHTYEFLHQIKVGAEQSERDKELFKFFNGGPYEPRLDIPEIYPTTGGTPEKQHGLRKHKKIDLNPNNSFAVDVATYMHELNHYIDTWYNSRAAKVRSKYKPESEKGKGIAKERSADLSPGETGEQVQALQEYLNVIIEEILSDMQLPNPRANENPHTIAERELYKAWDADTDPNKKKKDEFIAERRDALRVMALDPDIGYKTWGAQTNGPGGSITATGLEMGYAFEKQAYGFYDASQTTGKWAERFVDQFEKKYWMYLEDR